MYLPSQRAALCPLTSLQVADFSDTKITSTQEIINLLQLTVKNGVSMHGSFYTCHTDAADGDGNGRE